MKLLTQNVRKSQAITPTAGAAGATDINGATLDMAGFDRVCMDVHFGAITTGSEVTIKAQQGSLANMTDAEDLEGTSQVVADDRDGDSYSIDIRPTERYVRVVVTRAEENAVVACGTYEQYDGGNLPVTHGATWHFEQHLSPAEGDA